MSGKTVLGVVVTGVALFFFGFLYWGVNPLPYTAWNEVSDPAVAQTTAAALFPENGMYSVPGPGNDPAAMKLLETGPLVFVTIDHSPAAGPDPVALATGFVHNLLSALLLVWLLKGVSGTGALIYRALTVGVVAAFVILGSEVIWWMQPLNWIVHQVVYYLIYFVLGAWVLSFFLPREAAD